MSQKVKGGARVADPQISDAVGLTMKAWGKAFRGTDLQPFEIALRIHRLNLMASAEVDILLRPLKIGSGDADVLARLYESGHPYVLTPGQLATQCFVTTGAMTGRIDRLERAKVVVRLKSERDRRSTRIQLTKRGVDHAKSIFLQLLSNPFSDGVRAMSALDRRRLVETLRALERRVLVFAQKA
jgi:DNA-binding MarR family transcriptional regulator